MHNVQRAVLLLHVLSVLAPPSARYLGRGALYHVRLVIERDGEEGMLQSL